MALMLCDAKTDDCGRELAQHGCAQFPVACYHDDLTGTPVPWHWHTELEVLVVSEGTAVVAAGTQRFILRQGEGAFVNSGVLHAAWSHGQPVCRLHSAVFHPRLVGGGPDSIFWTGYLQPLIEAQRQECVCFDGSELWHREAVQAVEAAWISCAQEPPGYEFWTRDALSRLVFLLSSHQPDTRMPRSGKALREEGRVKLMLEYIRSHYTSELSTAAIAHSAMVSESECLRCFRSIIGQTPIQYVIQYRVQKAAELLSASELSVSEIGARCGFQDASYFSKTFRTLKGCAPSEYRKKIAERAGRLLPQEAAQAADREGTWGGAAKHS